MLPHEITDATAEGDTAQTDRPGVAERDTEAVCARGGRELDRGGSRFGPGGATRHVDVDSAHVVEVDHDATLAEAVAERIVAAAPDRELGTGLTRVRDDSRHTLSVYHTAHTSDQLVD